MNVRNGGLCESGSMLLAELRPLLEQLSNGLAGVQITVVVDPILQWIAVLDTSQSPPLMLMFNTEPAPAIVDAASAFLTEGLGQLQRSDANSISTDARLAVMVDGLGLSLRGVQANADGSVRELFAAAAQSH